MIVSHKHQFVFIKTVKTAGTTFEIILSKFCGPDDVITPLDQEDERLRQKMGFRGPQNQQVPLKYYTPMDWLRFIKHWNHFKLYRDHFEARKARQYLGEETWKEYFTFCFERNPYDQVISRYFFATRDSEERPSLTQFLEEDPRLSNWRFYAIKGEVAVDFVGRYECLKEDAARVAQRIGLPSDLSSELDAIHAKGTHRGDRRHHSEFLNEEQRVQIESACAREIDLLGYKFWE